MREWMSLYANELIYLNRISQKTNFKTKKDFPSPESNFIDVLC